MFESLLGFPDGGGCGRFCVRFLQRARGRIEERQSECELRGARPDALPGLVAAEARGLEGRADSRKIDNTARSTVAELLNRYRWIRVPRE